MEISINLDYTQSTVTLYRHKHSAAFLFLYGSTNTSLSGTAKTFIKLSDLCPHNIAHSHTFLRDLWFYHISFWRTVLTLEAQDSWGVLPYLSRCLVFSIQHSISKSASRVSKRTYRYVWRFPQPKKWVHREKKCRCYTDQVATKAAYAAHITSDRRTEVMKNEVEVILDFHKWLDNLSQSFYRLNHRAMH